MTEKKVQILKVSKTFLPLYNFISGEQMKSQISLLFLQYGPSKPKLFLKRKAFPLGPLQIRNPLVTARDSTFSVDNNEISVQLIIFSS